ncbi:TetR/AcrR family transcriptional regulator [Heyndrickxia oleronia]|jgi:AcrR family transcriptional regulator|uniref:TetR/AcrR family transcriptional regulator n=1 Tax=Heyndrickxia oleronia TaxID=38875 RepID=UPI00242BDBB5|nr:TetR/AcrR family transcriptional regulator [Heyndrickxia oleronia]MCI1591523.1 TetR family transcriptional regulator [Heyndrickxia oleronia]MCI1614341.1 TetR family transcriptional regulator [Heyndrickxia oleronia]MCI1745415.1 TetR family transcriptional regulator [Heyndrickxia oleronia]MCI1762222.1 TetR family transcriptional regulator [Heyndrickxia oleronia]
MEKGKQSFIAEARRDQIIEAAIKTLDEIGYVKSSLSQIAKRAGISTALISYHFSNKEDLMNHLLTKLLEESTSYIMDHVLAANSAQEKLNAFIKASLSYQNTHPAHNTALIEIVFNARTPENIPYYKLVDDNEEDPILAELKLILYEGQKRGEFTSFHVDVMANVIQGAINEYMFTNPVLAKKVDLNTYINELVHIISSAVKK